MSARKHPNPLIAEVGRILEALEEFYEPQEAREWMLHRQPRLGDPHETPWSAVMHGNAEKVWELIDQLRSGAFI